MLFSIGFKKKMESFDYFHYGSSGKFIYVGAGTFSCLLRQLPIVWAIAHVAFLGIYRTAYGDVFSRNIKGN